MCSGAAGKVQKGDHLFPSDCPQLLVMFPETLGQDMVMMSKYLKVLSFFSSTGGFSMLDYQLETLYDRHL